MQSIRGHAVNTATVRWRASLAAGLSAAGPRCGGVPRPGSRDAIRQRGGQRDPGADGRRTDDRAPKSETAVLAGGCFWGVQGVYQHVKGVTSAQSGYAGGDAATANYDTVSTETTGHAESVRITYDPTQITYGQLLRVFFSVVQDPTELNYQGPDVGPSYRSVIFAQDDTQRNIANAYIGQLNAAGAFSSPIVTTVSSGQFFPAEAYHQDFLSRNPNNPYIVQNDLPKLGALRSTYPELYRD